MSKNKKQSNHGSDEQEKASFQESESIATEKIEKAVNENEKEQLDNILDFETKKSEMQREEVDLVDLNQEMEELKKTVQRTQADFMNYKRRTEEERKKIASFANEGMIVEFLDVLDNFDRAIEQGEGHAQNYVDGVVLIKKQIFDILVKHGVKEINAEGEFDPNFHFAVMQEEGDEPGKILEVFQKGYLLLDKVIRPSMVKVSK